MSSFSFHASPRNYLCNYLYFIPKFSFVVSSLLTAFMHLQQQLKEVHTVHIYLNIYMCHDIDSNLVADWRITL